MRKITIEIEDLSDFGNEKMKFENWYNYNKEINSKIEEKMVPVTERNRNRIPYTTQNGRFDDKSVTDPCWWTNGFWGGEMWQLFALTGNEMFRQEAIGVEEKLDKNLMTTEGLDHDNGFKSGRRLPPPPSSTPALPRCKT